MVKLSLTIAIPVFFFIIFLVFAFMIISSKPVPTDKVFIESWEQSIVVSVKERAEGLYCFGQGNRWDSESKTCFVKEWNQSGLRK